MGIEPGHPNLEALLAHLDGGGAEITAAHIAHCPACARECERLARVRAGLRALAPPAPPDAWPAIRSGLVRRNRRARAPLALATAASLLVAVGAVTWLHAPATGRAQDRVGDLVAESQALERLLSQHGRPARVMDLRTAATVAQLQDQIGVIDDALTLAGGRDSQLAERLWGQRVELMQGLAELNARPVAYREY